MRRRLDAHPPTVRGGRTGRPGGTRGIISNHGLDGLATEMIIVFIIVIIVDVIFSTIVMVGGSSAELRGNVCIEMRSVVLGLRLIRGRSSTTSLATRSQERGG